MKLVQKLTLALLSMVVAGSACAGPLISKINDTTSLSSLDVSPLTLVHNFTLETDPFRLGIDTITSAVLTIVVKDDSGRNGGGDETFSFSLGNGETFGGSNLDNTPTDFTHTLLNLAGLNSTGIMQVSVAALTGAFQFHSSTLEVQVTRGTVVVEPPVGDVPEPLSIALLGLGLAGMSVVRRRK